MNRRKPTNEAIAGLLEEIAGLLELQEDNPHRIRAYRAGAESVRNAAERYGRFYARSVVLQSAPEGN